MRTGFSIRTRLVAAFVGVALVSTFVIALVANLVFTNQTTKLLGQDLQAITDSAAKETGTVLELNIDRLSVVSLNRFVQDSVDDANLKGTSSLSELTALDAEWANASQSSSLVRSVIDNEIAAELVEFQDRFPNMVEVFITDQYGAVIASTNKTSDYYQADEEWWQKAWNDRAGAFYISQPDYDESSQSYSVDFAIPIRGHTREDIVGILRATVDISEIGATLTDSRFGETGHTDIYFANEQYLTDDLSKGLIAVTPETINLLNTISGDFSEIDYEGVPSFVSRSQVTSNTAGISDVINGLNWYTVSHQDSAEALSPAIQTTRLIVLVSFGLLLVVALLAYVLGTTFTRPIESLTVAATRLAQGEIDTDVKVESQDEIGTLAASFNKMSSQIRELITSLEQRVAARTQALTTVAEVGNATATILDTRKLLQNVVDLTKERFNLYHSHIYLLDNSGENLVLAAGAGDPGRIMVAEGRSIPLNREQSLVARAARERKGVIVNDVAETPDFLPNPLLPDTHAELAVPMVVGDTLIGVLDIQSEERGRFTEADNAIQTTLAAQIATSIQNARYFEQADKVARELGVVAEISTATANITDPLLFMQEVVDKTKAAFNLYHVHIYLLNEAGDTLELATGAGEVGRKMVAEKRSIPLDSEKSLVARAARTRKGAVVNDVHADPDFLPNPLLPDTRSEQAVPMIAGDTLIGVLDVQSEQLDRFTEIDINVKTTLAAQIATSIQNARNFENTQRLQEQYSLAVEGSNDGIWDWDLRTNQVYFSPRWKAMVGYGEDELNNGFADFEALLHPDDHDRALAAVNDYLSGKNETYDIEFQFHHKDGSYRWIRARGKLLRDESGAPFRMAGSHSDVTDRKLAEKSAEESLKQLDAQRFALDQHSIVAITDVSGKITYANDKFVEISKYTREELIGQDHRILNSGYHSKEFIRNLWVTIANGKVFHGELHNRAKDGSLYWVDTTIVPFLNEQGKPFQYVAIRTDITQRKRAEELMSKRATELQAVAEISTRASQTDNIQDLLQTVVELTKKSYNLYHTHIYLLNDDKSKLVLAAGAGEVGRKMVSERRTIDYDHPHSLVARAARTGQGAISNDVTQEPDFLPNPLLPNTKAEMAIPIRSGDTVLGVLDVQADYINRFTDEDIAIKTTLAQQVAASLENLRQYQISQKVARELAVVANVSTTTATITDTQLLLQEVVDKTKAAFNLYHVHIYLLNEAGDTLELAAGAGEIGRKMVAEGRQIPLDSEKSLVARAARTRKGAVVNDVRADPEFLPNPLLPETRSEQAVPMIVGDKVLGVLDVQSEQLDRFTEIDVNVKTTLAAQTAVALQNARTYSQAQQQAQREALLNSIGQKIQSATSVEAVLQIAARELGRALNAPMTIAQLGMQNARNKESLSIQHNGNGSNGNGNNGNGNGNNGNGNGNNGNGNGRH